jgi:hypothetical protein
MKFRVDLLKFITEEDILEGVLANNHRYQAEPLFSQTGVGSLASATEEEKAREVERAEAFVRRLKERAARAAQAEGDDAWDRQLDADAAAGKLDFPKREAEEARRDGKLRDWPPAGGDEPASS